MTEITTDPEVLEYLIKETRPCPFCGNIEEGIEVCGGKAEAMNGGEEIGPIRGVHHTHGYIFCSSCLCCGASGPQTWATDESKAKYDAVIAWNSRAGHAHH